MSRRRQNWRKNVTHEEFKVYNQDLSGEFGVEQK